MNGRFQMQGGKNWIFATKMNANRFFWDSHWLEIWSNHFCPSMRPNGGSVAMDSVLSQSRQSAKLFLQSSELGLPQPLTRRRVRHPPPPVLGGGAPGGTLACEKGVGRFPVPTRGQCLTHYIYVLCAVLCMYFIIVVLYCTCTTSQKYIFSASQLR
jgi:hypothetical protein